MLMFVYDPATFPMTFTEKEHEEFAARVAPVILMVLPPAVAVMVWPDIEPVVHVGPDKPFGVVTARPAGRVSEKLTLVKEVALGLVKAKVSVLLLPKGMDVGEKDLESVGGTGRGQPVMVTLSRNTEASGLLFCAPATIIRKYVVAALAGDDVLFEMVPQLLPKVLLVQGPVPNAVPALSKTYQLSPFDQLPCKLALEVMTSPP